MFYLETRYLKYWISSKYDWSLDRLSVDCYVLVDFVDICQWLSKHMLFQCVFGYSLFTCFLIFLLNTGIRTGNYVLNEKASDYRCVQEMAPHKNPSFHQLRSTCIMFLLFSLWRNAIYTTKNVINTTFGGRIQSRMDFFFNEKRFFCSVGFIHWQKPTTSRKKRKKNEIK